MPAKTILQIRRGSSEEWSVVNPTLDVGELGLDTTHNLLKAGDGITVWNSLSYISSGIAPEDIQDIVGNLVVGASGIGIDYQDSSNQLFINVTGIETYQINDFKSNIYNILPPITGTSGIVVDYTNNTYTVALNDPTIQTSDVTDFIDAVNDRVDDLLQPGSNISLTYIDNGDTTSALTIDVTGVAVSGHKHTVSDITDFDSSISGLLPITQLSEGSGIGISNIGTDFTISVTGIPASLVSGFKQAVNSTLIPGTGIDISYSLEFQEATISTMGVSLEGHKHELSDITGVSASATEINYLSGSLPGTGVAGKALVLDNDLNITNIGNLSTTGNITVGGDLIVSGTTTTVNSTVVDIGDNIIRVNTSGLSTGGFEVFTGSDQKQLIWNNTNNRWEIGGNVYSSGIFIGNLQGNADTVTSGVYLSDIGTITSTMIANNTIVDEDISLVANINVGKLSASGITLGVTPIILGDTVTNISGMTELSGSSIGNPMYINWAVIDGGTP